MKRTFSDVGEMQYPTHLILLVACSRILGPPVRPDRGGGYAAVFQDLEIVCLVYVRAERSVEKAKGGARKKEDERKKTNTDQEKKGKRRDG